MQASRYRWSQGFYTIVSILLLLFVWNGCGGDATLPRADDYQCSTPWTNTHPRSAQLQAFLESKVAQGVPGAAILIKASNGVWAGAAGLADIERGVAMQPCHITRIASITKLFVATVVLMLVEDGLLTLDDAAAPLLPEEVRKNVANADQATIRQLLNHTSGVFNYYEDLEFQLNHVLNDPESVQSLEEILQQIHGRPAYFAPGTGWRYSNSNYVLLGLIIRAKTGKTWQQVLQERILDPLSLSRTYALESGLPPGITRGYVDLFGEGRYFDATEYTVGNYEPGGGMIANLYDMATFAETLYRSNLISLSSITAMTQWTAVPDADQEEQRFRFTHYGLGTYRLETSHGYGVGHSGGNFGYRSELFYFPDLNLVYAIVANGVSSGAEEIITAINREILDVLLQ